MSRCGVCGKKRIFGVTHRHHRGVAGGQWTKRAQKTQKIFKPNIHVFWVNKNGQRTKLKLCTKCLRKAKAEQEVTSKVSTPAAVV